MTRVKLLANISWGRYGTIIDLDDYDASVLLQGGKAELVSGETPPPPPPPPPPPAASEPASLFDQEDDEDDSDEDSDEDGTDAPETLSQED